MKCKRFFAALLCALMLCGGALAEENDWYAERAVELAAHMTELACDEGYVSVYFSSSDKTLSEALTLMRQNKDREVVKVTQFDYVEDKLDAFFATFAGDGAMDGLSEVARAEIERALPQMLGNVLNTWAGTGWLAVSSALKVERGYVEPEGFAPRVIVLDYGTEVFAVVTFARMGEGVIKAQTLFVKGFDEAQALMQIPMWVKR